MKFIHKPIPIVVLALCLAFGFTPESRAAYLEPDTETPRPIDRAGDYRPPRPRYADNPVTRLVEQIEVGRPCQYRGLTIYPLYRRSARGFTDIKTLDEAVDNHWILIREKDQSMVSEVTVRNESRYYVFLMAGELLLGGKQNRFIRDDVLLPPCSRDIDVAVYCSEKERWTPRTDKFESPGCLAQTELRRCAARGAAQEEIWTAVDSQSEKAKITSPTRDYHRIYDSPSLKRELEEYADHFRDIRRADTVGAVAVVGGRILSCDFFSDPTLCSRLWNKLVRAHALDAICPASPERPCHKEEWRDGLRRVPQRLDPSVADCSTACCGMLHRPADERGAISEHDIRHYLEATLTAQYEGQHGAGAGELLRISGSVEGMTLTWDNRVVHAALFGEWRHEDVTPMPKPYPVPMLNNETIWR